MYELLVIGIDATNIYSGGGLTHLVELISHVESAILGKYRIVVFGSADTLACIDDRPFLEKRTFTFLNRGLISRVIWQFFCLSQLARDSGCNVLLIPGGIFFGNFSPVVAISQNLLPFQLNELLRYKLSLTLIRLLVLRLLQSRTFKNSDGLVFLTNYSRDQVLNVIGKTSAIVRVIPHGLNLRFKQVPKPQRLINTYDDVIPYRVLYVSIIDQYKHQWYVVDAIAALRLEGWPVVLDLVGPAYPPALNRLEKAIELHVDHHLWLRYFGNIPYKDLHTYYTQADLGLFASSCENMPNILLETMASGLPIACSNRGPMPEILAGAGIYFDPEQPAEIAHALRKLISSPKLRFELSQQSFQLAQQYVWERCAKETFGFLESIALQGAEG